MELDNCSVARGNDADEWQQSIPTISLAIDKGLDGFHLTDISGYFQDPKIKQVPLGILWTANIGKSAGPGGSRT